MWSIMNRKRAADCPGQSAHALLPVCMVQFLERRLQITSTFVAGLNFEPETLRGIADPGLSMDVDVILNRSDGE